ncbi:hypothetical protein DBR32_03275 [Taibaiella sp. KBW10]|uniref:T9SS type A sorting domain-containing protein n=1 Tax=Taibaiella sp. KBW10 TaxID=2153357 RepID=UPI000F590B7D|nr:T9SS type A sorting domain-containing protein [Taibaiella sp. KBW10]RQO32627.1 hypothetical protein DBR32_03275 [Taibaiella sp. KBW10]
MNKYIYNVKIIIALVATFPAFNAKAQTIPNPDFETYSACPSQQVNPTYALRATAWTRPTLGTSDYFNSCGYSIPGVITAFSGTGFVGSYMEVKNGSLSNYKEYLTTRLSAPLIAGTTYMLSFYTAHLFGASPPNMLPTLSYADLPEVEQGYIGAVFSTVAPVNSNSESGFMNSGSIVNTFGNGRVLIPASDTVVYGAASRNTWVPVTLQYTAVGGEEYLTFGQFRQGTTSLPDGTGAYYLFDNLSASLISTPLSVTLQNFSVEKYGFAARLKWETLSEQNNKGFELQRSADGINWEILGFEASKSSSGNSSEPLLYSYIDTAPLSGSNYYRLNNIDYDGKQQYSSVQMLKFNHNASVAIYPNPVRSELSINNLEGVNTIKLINTYGHTITTSSTGNAATKLDFSSLPDGVYTIQIVNENGCVKTMKVTKD